MPHNCYGMHRRMFRIFSQIVSIGPSILSLRRLQFPGKSSLLLGPWVDNQFDQLFIEVGHYSPDFYWRLAQAQLMDAQLIQECNHQHILPSPNQKGCYCYEQYGGDCNIKFVSRSMNAQNWCICVNDTRNREMGARGRPSEQEVEISTNREIIFTPKRVREPGQEPKYIHYLRPIFKSPNCSHDWPSSKISLREYKEVRNIICSMSPRRLAAVRSPIKTQLTNKKTS